MNDTSALAGSDLAFAPVVDTLLRPADVPVRDEHRKASSGRGSH